MSEVTDIEGQVDSSLPQPVNPPGIEEINNPFKVEPMTSKYGPKPAEIHGVKVYQGDLKKSEVLNWGEQEQDRAVPFQLKMGVNTDSLIFNVDPDDPERITIVPTINEFDQLKDDEMGNLVYLRKVGNMIQTEKMGEEVEKLTHEDIAENPVIIPLNDQIGLKILDFNPDTNSVIVQKTKVEPKPVVPIDPTWKDRVRRGLTTAITIATVGTSTLIPGDSSIAQETPLVPPAVTEDVPVNVNTETPTIIVETDESLKCPETKEMVVKDGDFLTKMLVDVNGEGRYVLPEGGMNVDLLYKDLMCLLAIPENLNELDTSDPVVAKYVKERMSIENLVRFGPATATALYRGLLELNSPNGQDRYPNASKQLVIVYKGQNIKVPNFVGTQ